VKLCTNQRPSKLEALCFPARGEGWRRGNKGAPSLPVRLRGPPKAPLSPCKRPYSHAPYWALRRPCQPHPPGLCIFVSPGLRDRSRAGRDLANALNSSRLAMGIRRDPPQLVRRLPDRAATQKNLRQPSANASHVQLNSTAGAKGLTIVMAGIDVSARPVGDQFRFVKKVRTSLASAAGCSRAAKCPPLGITLHRWILV
jgi:hypothetical protein